MNKKQNAGQLAVMVQSWEPEFNSIQKALNDNGNLTESAQFAGLWHALQSMANLLDLERSKNW